MDKQLVADAHTHVFCWGEDPRDGFLSERTRKAWLTRFAVWWTGIRREAGATLTEKIRNRLLREVTESQLDYVVVLAQDAIYRHDGSRDETATDFYVSNQYVLELADRSPKILAGCSINPIRQDALAELERCYEAGCRLIKVHTSIQGVDPALAEYDPFYRRARELGVVLMFHTGYEHSCKVVCQEFADPSRLARVLDHGGPVIAAHSGTCAFFDPEDYYPSFIRMMQHFDNLHGDTSILATLARWRSLKRLSREPPGIRSRIIHGSDYPLPPSRLPYLRRTGLFPPQRHNPLDLDLAIKESFDFGPRYASQILELMGIGPA
jgi:predicted TIM-barrel fold metal-dependent hydrolase